MLADVKKYATLNKGYFCKMWDNVMTDKQTIFLDSFWWNVTYGSEKRNQHTEYCHMKNYL
jgi:hypothetical protein